MAVQRESRFPLQPPPAEKGTRTVTTWVPPLQGSCAVERVFRGPTPSATELRGAWEGREVCRGSWGAHAAKQRCAARGGPLRGPLLGGACTGGGATCGRFTTGY